jgi:hypothetical protein
MKKKEKKSTQDINLVQSSSDIENSNIKLEMNLKLRDLRLLSKYLEEELLVGLNNILTKISTNDENLENQQAIEYYSAIYDIFGEMAEVVYRSLIEKEKKLIDEFKKQGISVNDVITILAKEPNDKARISNIYEAIDDLNLERDEAQDLFEKLEPLTKKILNKIDTDINNLYMPLIVKFISFLSEATRSFDSVLGEAIFSESSLEELLDLDIGALDTFLTKLSKIRVKVGKTEGFLIDDFTIYNDTTVVVTYPIFITNPSKYQKHFGKFENEDVEVSFEF